MKIYSFGMYLCQVWLWRGGLRYRNTLYRSPNDNPCYVHVYSNHPLNTIKQLPSMLNQRICELSSNAEVFRKSRPIYEAVLKKKWLQGKSGHSNVKPLSTGNEGRKSHGSIHLLMPHARERTSWRRS